MAKSTAANFRATKVATKQPAALKTGVAKGGPIGMSKPPTSGGKFQPVRGTPGTQVNPVTGAVRNAPVSAKRKGK